MTAPPTFSDGVVVHATDLNFLLNPPACMVQQNTAQAAIPASTYTPITFDAESYDPYNLHSTSTNTSRVNIGLVLGWWQVSGCVSWATNATGNTRRCILGINGTFVNGSQILVSPAPQIVSAPLPGIFVQSTVNTDYIELQGWHDATGSVATLVSGTYRSYLAARYLAAA